MSDMSYPMRLRASLEGDVLAVKVLISHPMDSGLSRDETGALHEDPGAVFHLTRIELVVNGETVFAGECGPGLAADPLLGWRLRGGRAGDRVEVRWSNNRGESGRLAAVAEGRRPERV